MYNCTKISRTIFVCFVFAAIVLSGCGKKQEEIKITKYSDKKTGDSSVTSAAGDKKEILNSVFSSKDALNHINESGTVKGYIADVAIREKVAYLNFDDKYPKNNFSAVIFKDKFSLFGDLLKFRNKKAEVSGKITIYVGKAQIILESPEQIKIVN